MSMSYLTLIVVTMVIGLGATTYVNGQIKKYNRVRCSVGLTGAQACRQMLDYYGLHNVPIKQGSSGQDFFDPRSNSITLDPTAFSTASITSMATACHEVGHAVQYAQGYTPMKVRGAIVPVVNFCSNAWVFVLLLGIFMQMAGLVNLAIALYAGVVIFQLVTLPVEFNASNRAMEYMRTTGMAEAELKGSYSVLRACALTYVAAALISVLQLLYLLGQGERN